jgi:hypothetical protein
MLHIGVCVVYDSSSLSLMWRSGHVHTSTNADEDHNPSPNLRDDFAIDYSIQSELN